jgi:peptidoglycan hydrolase CwlO-like protein
MHEKGKQCRKALSKKLDTVECQVSALRLEVDSIYGQLTSTRSELKESLEIADKLVADCEQSNMDVKELSRVLKSQSTKAENNQARGDFFFLTTIFFAVVVVILVCFAI